MESLTIRLDEQLAQKITDVLKPYYSTKTEFVREAIRDKLKTLETERLVDQLRQIQGSAKDVIPRKISAAEYAKMGEELGNMSTSEFLREHNLEGIPIIGKVSDVSRHKK